MPTEQKVGKEQVKVPKVAGTGIVVVEKEPAKELPVLNVSTAPHVIRAISDICGNVKPVEKNGENSDQGWKYRKAEDIMKIIGKMLCEYKVAVIPNVLSSSTRPEAGRNGRIIYVTDVTMEFTITSAVDGSSIKSTVCAQAFDFSDKGLYKCYTFAWKNWAQIIFAIPVMDDPDQDAIERDNDSNNGDVEHAQVITLAILNFAKKLELNPALLAKTLGVASSDPKSAKGITPKMVEEKARELANLPPLT